MAEINPLRQKALDYLESFGLDGREIVAHDWSSDGFHLYRKGADPEKVHPWPEGFNVPWLNQILAAADAEDYRIAGVRNRV